MKEKRTISLSQMAAMSLGEFPYEPGKPDAEAPGIPQADEPCDYTNGGQNRNNFINPFADWDYAKRPIRPSGKKTTETRMMTAQIAAYLSHVRSEQE